MKVYKNTYEQEQDVIKGFKNPPNKDCKICNGGGLIYDGWEDYTDCPCTRKKK